LSAPFVIVHLLTFLSFRDAVTTADGDAEPQWPSESATGVVW
jgi:hypothetical protein